MIHAVLGIGNLPPSLFIPGTVKICVIFNPSARGERAKHFREQLAKVANHCVCKPTYAAGSARPLAAEAVREGFDVVAAAGGDGTVNEVLNGIGEVPGAFENVRLGVLPFGTVNVFARELRIPLTFERAWRTLVEGAETSIDLPQAEYTSGGKPARRYFAQMAGAGWDARAIELVDWGLKKKFGKYAYFVAGIKAWLGAMPNVEAFNGAVRANGPLALVGNGRFYGGNWALFPLADLQDGLLEVSVFPSLSVVGAARGLCGLLTNSLYRIGGVKHFRARTLELSSAAPVWLQLDGENVCPLPARLSVEPRGLRVICPASFVRRAPAPDLQCSTSP